MFVKCSVKCSALQYTRKKKKQYIIYCEIIKIINLKFTGDDNY